MSIIINKGSINPIAISGDTTTAKIGVEANAAPEPNPPLLTPANSVATVAKIKNVKLSSKFAPS